VGGDIHHSSSVSKGGDLRFLSESALFLDVLLLRILKQALQSDGKAKLRMNACATPHARPRELKDEETPSIFQQNWAGFFWDEVHEIRKKNAKWQCAVTVSPKASIVVPITATPLHTSPEVGGMYFFIRHTDLH
jgi:hypothetical protein